MENVIQLNDPIRIDVEGFPLEDELDDVDEDDEEEEEEEEEDDEGVWILIIGFGFRIVEPRGKDIADISAAVVSTGIAAKGSS